MSAVVTLDSALDTVRMTPAQLTDLGGSVLDAGPAYLVGSLASGLGNRGSDVDIQVFVEGLDRPTPPYLFFHGEVPVDIEHVPADAPERALATMSRAERIETALGPLVTSAVPDRRTLRLVARWMSAVPVRAGDAALYATADLTAVRATLVRAALDRMLVAWALAVRVGSEAGGYAWGRAARALLDLHCRRVGDFTTGDKWLARRALVCGLDETAVRRYVACGDRAPFLALLRDTVAPLAAVDPAELVTFGDGGQTRRVKLGAATFALTAHGRLVPSDASGWAAEAEGLRVPAVLIDQVQEVLRG